MKSFTNCFPWQFWFIWGWLGILVLLKYAILPRKNTPPVPFAWKISWVVCFFLSFLVIVDSYISGTGHYSEYVLYLGRIELPAILLLALTVLVGCYQISMRPGFDPAKRRTLLIQILIFIGCIILLGFLMGPFIWNQYYKNWSV